MYHFDCIIVGSGIAGMTSAIYLKRANVNVLILDNAAPGGLLNKIKNIENYPGYTKISGPDLAYNIYEQVKNLNVEIRYGNVLDIKEHKVITDIEEYTAKYVIIATGRQARKLDGTNNLSNVSYCAVCDGNFYKDKDVALIGNNQHTIDDAIYLSDICHKVFLFGINDNKIKKYNNIEFVDSVIKTLKSNNNMLESIVAKSEIKVDGLFVSMGYEPKVNFLNDIVKDNNYIIVDKNMRTNVDYIYACGDIIKKDIYQLTTAVGEATIAAINIKKNLNREIV